MPPGRNPKIRETSPEPEALDKALKTTPERSLLSSVRVAWPPNARYLGLGFRV